MKQSRRDLVLRLRSTYGYTVRDANRAVDDVMNALLDLLEELDVGEKVVLKHIGSLKCFLRLGRWQRVAIDSNDFVRRPSTPFIRFHPSGSLAAQLRSRPLPDDDPRVPAERATYFPRYQEEPREED